MLLAKGGGETEKQIYRFTKGDSDLSLRFDLTVPLAKYVCPALRRADVPVPPFPDRQRFTAVSAHSAVVSASSIRRTSTSSVTASWTSSTGRGAEHHLQDVPHFGSRALQDPHQQPQGAQRLLCHPRPDRKAGDVMRTIDKLEDRRRKVKDHSGRGFRRGSCYG